MIPVYEAILNDENLPDLLVIQELDAPNDAYSIQETAQLLKDELFMDILADEHVYLVGYNDLLQITGLFPIAIGDFRSCNVYNRKVVSDIILSGSTFFCIFHNHPNQILMPSEDDISVASIMNDIGDLIQTKYSGSYIITKKGWISVDDFQTVYEW